MADPRPPLQAAETPDTEHGHIPGTTTTSNFLPSPAASTIQYASDQLDALTAEAGKLQSALDAAQKQYDTAASGANTGPTLAEATNALAVASRAYQANVDNRQKYAEIRAKAYQDQAAAEGRPLSEKEQATLDADLALSAAQSAEAAARTKLIDAQAKAVKDPTAQAAVDAADVAYKQAQAKSQGIQDSYTQQQGQHLQIQDAIDQQMAPYKVAQTVAQTNETNANAERIKAETPANVSLTQAQADEAASRTRQNELATQQKRDGDAETLIKQLGARIAKGEITPDEAGQEYDKFKQGDFANPVYRQHQANLAAQGVMDSALKAGIYTGQQTSIDPGNTLSKQMSRVGIDWHAQPLHPQSVSSFAAGAGIDTSPQQGFVPTTFTPQGTIAPRYATGMPPQPMAAGARPPMPAAPGAAPNYASNIQGRPPLSFAALSPEQQSSFMATGVNPLAAHPAVAAAGG